MWVRSDGQEMQHDDWNNFNNHVLGMLLSGEATDEVDDRGRPLKGDTMLLLLNGGDSDCRFNLPHVQESGAWLVLVDSAHEERTGPPDEGSSVTVDAHAMVLLRHGTERRLVSPEPVAAAPTAPSEGVTG